MTLRPDQLPPYLYLPTTVGTDADDYRPELREGENGPGLVAYTALDRLRRVWGADQTWAVVPLTALTEIRDSTGFVSLLLDDGLPEEERARG